ncbi:MAG: hypothetical protein GQ574_26755 [Crocinitomix sp.]|nr:hypothetical protein [Crocinitomix sp.]
MKVEGKKKKKWLPKPTKKQLIKTAKGTAIDAAVLGAGTLVSSAMGKWSLALGAALVIGGNYVQKDISEYLRLAGVAAIAWGVAKVTENEQVEEDATISGVGFVAMKEGAKNRLINFKNNWVKALRIDKLTKSNSSQESESSIGSIDLSALDTLEDSVKRSAVDFQMSQMDDEGDYPYGDGELIEYSDEANDLEQFNGIYAEEEFDLSTI